MIRGNLGLGISQEGVDRQVEDIVEPPVALQFHGEPVVDNTPCCIGMWNLDLHTKAQVWGLLKRLCRWRMFCQIQQIQRICQKRNRKVRFEIVIPRAWQIRAENRLEKAKFRMAYSWKTLAPRRVERPPNRLAAAAVRPDVEHITLCSLNINGVKTKIQALREYLESRKVSAICLQETLRKANHWRLTLSGFGCVERPGEGEAGAVGAGRRGLALGVINESLTAFPVGTQSSFLVAERVYGSRLTQPFILGTVYIPHRHVTETPNVPLYRGACESLIGTVRNLRRKYPNDPLILNGDFNMNRKKVDALALRMLGMRRVPLRGEAQTFKKSTQGGDIDHVLISTEHYGLVRAAWVDRECDLSDHWPILVDLDMKIRGAREVIAPNPERWQVAKGKALRKEPEKLDLILDDNRFSALGPDTIDGRAELFVENCRAVGRDAGILSEARTGKSQPTTKQHRRAAEKQRRLYIAFRAAKKDGTVEEERAAHSEYKRQRKLTKRILKDAARAKWAAKIVQADRDFIDNPKTAWAWTSTTAGWRRKGGSLGIQPVLKQNGDLCTDPDKIDKAWTDHYQSLARDVIGFSQDPQHWEDIIPETPPHLQLPAASRDRLNGPLDVDEVIKTLTTLKSWKAPGEDRIPVDFFKIFACGSRENKAVRALTRICNAMFTTGQIPEVWKVAVVVSIFKKGDPTMTGNYRGISLMSSTLKVLLTALATRLQTVLEAQGMVVREQAGFRPREECMAQVMSLYEVLRRRFLNKEDTFVLFLDFQKAYDVVPHEALFRRLQVLGIHGQFLVFLKALYRESRIAIRRTDGSAGIPFTLERGLRQGCPLSPILFTVFINTIFDGEDNPGCSIPGLVDKICGLMFADDTVGLAATPEDLLRIKNRVCAWSRANGMTFGVGKCATMAFKWNDPSSKNNEVFNDPAVWHIDGIPIPTPEEYVYLGIKFHLQLLHNKDDVMQLMVNAQITKGQQALHELTPFLACASVPQKIKLSVVRCVIISKMLWGAELWGMSYNRVVMAQTVMNNAMRLILGVKGPKAFMPLACMMKELKLQPIWALVASRRMRIYYKFPRLNTWAAQLVLHPPLGFPPKERRRTWVTQTEWWIQRIKVPLGEGEILRVKRDGLEENDIQHAVTATKDEVTRRWSARKANYNPSTREYEMAKYKPFLKKENAFPPDFGRGLCIIQQLRCNGYWTGARIHKVQPQLSGCGFCNSLQQETRGHLIVECPAWASLREQYIAGDLRRWKVNMGLEHANLSPEELVKLTVVALGGTVDMYSANHYYPSKATYKPADAIVGRVKDPAEPEPGPIDYRPIPARRPRGGDVAEEPEWQWPTGRPALAERRPASPEWQWPTGQEGHGSPIDQHNVPWVHRVDPDAVIIEAEQGAEPNRELRRELEWEDHADQARPFWGRCAMLGMAAFLTRVDQKRVE
jgi:exonuclease III